MKRPCSSGYSVGNGTVGFDSLTALNADFVNASIDDGWKTCRSVIVPSRCTLNDRTTWPRSDIAAYGTNQLRRICAMKRRIHGPKSTPFVSNWIDGPKSPLPCTFCSVSPCVYFWTLRMASLSRPGGRLSITGFFDGSFRAIVDCVVVGSASAFGLEAGGAVASFGCSGCGREASAMFFSNVLPRDMGLSFFGTIGFSIVVARCDSSDRYFGRSGARSIWTFGFA